MSLLKNDTNASFEMATRYLSFPEDSFNTTDFVNEVKDAIAKNAEWTESVEWRISTWTDMSIRPMEHKGRQWFEVSVKCDHEFVCHCPSIERAVFFLGLYDKLIKDLYRQLGWASAPGKSINVRPTS